MLADTVRPSSHRSKKKGAEAAQGQAGAQAEDGRKTTAEEREAPRQKTEAAASASLAGACAGRVRESGGLAPVDGGHDHGGDGARGQGSCGRSQELGGAAGGSRF